MKISKIVAASLVTIPFAYAQNASDCGINSLSNNESQIVSHLTREELESMVSHLLAERNSLIKKTPNTINQFGINNLPSRNQILDLNLDSVNSSNQFEEIDLDFLERSFQRTDATRTSR